MAFPLGRRRTGRTAETTVRSVKTISADGSRVARLRAPFNEEGEVEEGDGREMGGHLLSVG